ncbi:hypothetical protein BDV27DRAFT_147234 [Aspergillus caelatus]|uniref:Uncharacterized protein n=2 Tax=Aspergillus subgen. Circumdati TaxID=2720871 RepID=A0A5N6ZYW4_9EURO|nr:uncharacterized protein BDV27DRAFT_147234 [Aspergillus caelatus]KAE8362129.1 hypothetical protein BDV27DRAFT_147234 [Aspergillus caelatus]KAE8413899.1 hypothetical protein BDV36DRAFT_286610 [Aspergillus pseudocaelatus]
MEMIDYQGDTRTSNVINFRRSKEGPPRSQVHLSPSLLLLSSLFLLCQDVPTQSVHILSLKEPSSNSFSFVEALSFFHSKPWLPLR